MAVDLREIVGALRIVSSLERMGDYAKNIAKRVIATGAEVGSIGTLRELQHMAELVRTAFRQVVDAYARRDVEKALAVWHGDQTIDAANDALFRELLAEMTADPRDIAICTHLLFCAKNIERIGDHATNIAETVYYIVQGVSLDAARPKGGATSSETPPAANGRV